MMQNGLDEQLLKQALKEVLVETLEEMSEPMNAHNASFRFDRPRDVRWPPAAVTSGVTASALNAAPPRAPRRAVQ